MKSAVLFLVFNRPDTTRQVFETIKSAQPPRLYVAADGPRTDRDGEREKCEIVRQIATAVSWPCELNTLFRDDNLGCKIGVSEGINWFFENEEEGIILEDDVLPLPSFFQYCDELLERYRHNDRVGAISGCNLVSKRFMPKDSYFFSRYNHVWGWATWRRAWKLYDVNMQAWPQWREQGGLASISDGNQLFERQWRDAFDLAFLGGIDTWDYQWTFTCWLHGMITALPAHNQTRNIGFGPDALHTTGNTPDYIKESIPELLPFPLRHPADIERKSKTDALIDRRAFGMTRKRQIKLKIKQGLRRLLKIFKHQKTMTKQG